MDNPVSWFIALIMVWGFIGYLFNKMIHDYNERRREAENYWENFHR